MSNFKYLDICFFSLILHLNLELIFLQLIQLTQVTPCVITINFAFNI